MVLEQRHGWARVYRGGRCVCRRAEVLIDRETRKVGLTAAECRRVRVRFLEQLSSELHQELVEIVNRRGAAAQRYAERVEPIVIAFENGQAGPVVIVGRIKPPESAPRIDLHETEFMVGTVPA